MQRPKPSARPLPSLLLLPALAISALALPLAGCREKPSPPTPADPLADELARERAAAHFEEGREAMARAELAPLAARADATPEDLLNMAALELALDDLEATRRFLDRLEAQAPRSPGLHYLLGQIAKEDGDFETAERHLRTAHREAPEDLPTRLELASVLRELDRLEEAEALFRSVVDVGIENGLGWYVSAVYQLQRLLLAMGRTEEAEPLLALTQALAREGLEAPAQSQIRQGTFGRVRPPAPRGNLGAAPLQELAYRPLVLDLPELAGALELFAWDLDGDGLPELLARVEGGLVAARRDGEAWVSTVVFDEPVDLVRAIDLQLDDGWTDLVVAQGSTLRFLVASGWSWEHEPRLDIELPSPAADLVAVDFDHDGDMDVFVVGDFGARLYRNDGADEPEAGGRFEDASETAGLPQGVRFTWCATEDFDDDNDVDLFCGGPEHVYLGDSQRAGRFADRSELLAGLRTAHRPLLADVDGSGRTDIVLPGAPLVRWMQTDEWRFERVATDRTVPQDAQLLDLDLDGALDLAWGSAALLALSLPEEVRVDFAGLEDARPTGPFAFGDFTGDRQTELVAVSGERLVLYRPAATPHQAHRLVLRGVKDNRRAVGSRVIVRAGPVYRRVYYRGEPVLIGTGRRPELDVVRIQWPNGGVQTQLGVPVGEDPVLDDPDAAFEAYTQEERLIGSCPFLYTWNGETFEFVTDVLGITPLGLPIAPGLMVPPDHDEYVLVRGSQLVPKDGELVIQITEELREVTYLDRVRLHVIDRPAEVEIFPNERFCFPPFPEHHVHTVQGALAPVRARGSDGRDWTQELAQEDGVHAVPFEREAPQYAGLARPWFLELEFDPERVAGAEKLRLLMTGWFNWSDASANMASARHPRVEFVPPILQVPDGDDGWRDAGPPIGFPAGKTKTMVVDVSELDLAADPRLRVRTTLQLYWDRIALAVDADDAPYVETVLEPTRARLYERGFSERVETHRDDSPEVFDWDRVEVLARWDQHPGLYTRLGDCLDLLTAIDDRFVIFGAGDALEVAFDAGELPPLPEGHARDYLVFFDGWAKDGDPNTLEALEVEPLPFHGMSGYPYGDDEQFPDTEEHRRWREEWNTRPGRRWIPPLAPRPIQ